MSIVSELMALFTTCLTYLLYRQNEVEVASLLLNHGSNPNLRRNDGLTPLDFARSSELISLLLEKGATPAYRNMDKCFPHHLQKQPTDMAIKTFVVGNPDAGKSTLVKSIEKEAEGIGSRIVSQLTKVKGVDVKTAGIIPHEIITKSLGRVILYDFAGHKEFYAGHDVLLRNSVGTSPSVVMLVINVTCAESEVRGTIEYWLEFLNQQHYDGKSKPHLLVIGSHCDQISSSNVASRQGLIRSLVKAHNLEHFVRADPIMLDCRYAGRSAMTELRKSLSQICQQSRSTERLEFASHGFLVFLLDKFRSVPAITIATAKRAINESVTQKVYRAFLQSLDILSCCKELNKQGSILFMSNRDHPERSWIILDKAVLLSQVNGKLFAPEDFKQHQKIANSTGVVPLSKLAAVFPDLNREMISQFLCHLEFCQEVTDSSVLCLLQSEDTSSKENERYFFFPSLVQVDTPDDLWQHSSDFDYYTGWILECLKAGQFLTPRFAQVLLLRLAFQLALISSFASTTSLTILRRCSVWKNGISWANQSGGEAIVEIVDQKKVVVMTRGKNLVKQPKVESVHLRSQIIRTVLSTMNELCSKVEIKESVIDPKDAVEYPINVTQAKCVSIKYVSQTVKEGKELVVLDNRETVSLKELLHFEPYANMNERLLKELHEDPLQHLSEISDQLISLMAKCARSNSDDFIAMIEPLLLTDDAAPGDVALVLRLWKDEMTPNGTLCRLHSLLDEYSIFAGRSPLDVVKGKSR